MNKQLVYFYIALLTVLCVLNGCGDSRAVGLTSKTAVVENGMAPLSGLPAPSTLRKADTVTSGVFRYGNQYASALSNQLVTANGNILSFAPAWLGDGLGGAAYAIYTFDSTGYSTDDTLHLAWQITGADFSDLWIGLADFTADRWDWFAGPASGALPYDASKYTAGGQVYAVVLCLGSDAWELKSVRISSELPPVVLSVSPAECTQGAPATFAATLDGTADNYSWDFGGGATPNTSTASAPDVTIGVAGDYPATLTVANASGEDVFSFVLAIYDSSTYSASGYVKSADGAGLSDVTLSFSGGLASVTTDNTGFWLRDGIPHGTYSVTPSMSGKWFSPVSRSFTIARADCPVADFTEFFAGQGDWCTFGHDAQRSGRSPFTGPATNALLWSYSTGGGVYSSPAMGADGTVYVGSNDGNLYAIKSDGSISWAYPMGGEVHSSPAIGADGTVYVGSDDGNLYAIDPGGNLLPGWPYATGDAVYSSPAIGADGTVYVGSNDGNLYALDSGGNLLPGWPYATGWAVDNSPAIGGDGTVYVECYGQLYAINPNGSLKWADDFLGGFYDFNGDSSPSIDADGTVYVVCGSSEYVQPLGEYFYYCNLIATNPDGSGKWSCDLLTSNSGFYVESRSPAAIGIDGTVYVGNDGYDGSSYGELYAISPIGDVKWIYFIDSPEVEFSSPAIGADGTVYAGCIDYNLYAINANGSLKWTYTTANRIGSSPAIGADGTVYVGSADGNLYAIGPGGG